MARPRDHRPTQRNRLQTNSGIETRRCFCVCDACCGSLLREGSVPRYDEWFGRRADPQREEACQTAGRPTAWSYCRDVEARRGVLVCGPQQAANHGRSSRKLGNICQWVCCSLFPITSINQRIMSRSSTSTPASKVCERQSSLRNSPRHAVSHPGLGAPAAMLNCFVGKQGLRHISRGFVVSRSSLPPRRTGSRSHPLHLIRRRRLSHPFLATNRLEPTHTVTPRQVIPINRCFRRSAQFPSSCPAAHLYSGLSHGTQVSSMNSDREGSEGLQTCPSELNRYSLRVRLLRYNSIHLTHLRAQTRGRVCIASSLLLPSIAAVIGIYHTFVWCRTLCPCV